MSQGVISQLCIYPVKSLQGIALEQAELTEQGIKWDRFWMIVNEDGQFATQRHFSKMAQITTAITEDALILSHPDAPPLHIALEYQGDTAREAKVWNSECEVLDEGAAVSQWLTELLGTWRGQALSLVRMAPEFSRIVSDKHTPDSINSTLFADGYPYLVCNTASLEALNERLTEQGEQPVPMSRFRANIVVQTEQAFVEHTRSALTLAEQSQLHLCKPCQRCKVTGIDQQSGDIVAPKQPLSTLLELGNVPKKGAYFGENAVISEGSKAQLPITIRVGETVFFNELA